MAGTWIIGLDIGTTGCKAVAVDACGMVLAATGGTYPLHTPATGGAEQDVREIDREVCRSLRDLLAQTGTAGLAGVALSGAMHSLLPVREDGRPLGRAMIWADQRAAGEAARLRQNPAARKLVGRTGCPLTATYHVARGPWLSRHGGASWRRAQRVAAIKDWFTHRLTGVWATDVGLASTTGLLDLRTLRWDRQALDLAELDARKLPELRPGADVVGTIRRSAAGATGLPVGLPVVLGSSDGGLANVGAGAVEVGDVVVTVGTSGAVRRVVDRPLPDPSGRLWCYALDHGRYFTGGAINNGGLAVFWVRDQFFGGDLQALLRAAETVAPGAEGLTLLPYFTGERSPYWKPDARAVLAGLTLAHTPAHIARAVLEGVAFGVADVWQAMFNPRRPARSHRGRAVVRLTGGITRIPMWGQIMAEVLHTPLQPVEAADASALGAAMVGLGALGVVDDWPALARRAVKGEHLLRPDKKRAAAYRLRHEHFQQLGRQVVFGAGAGSIMGT